MELNESRDKSWANEGRCHAISSEGRCHAISSLYDCVAGRLPSREHGRTRLRSSSATEAPELEAGIDRIEARLLEAVQGHCQDVAN
jgi:hypothetical protein